MTSTSKNAPSTGSKTRKRATKTGGSPASIPDGRSKLDIIAGMIRREGGSTIVELVEATGWQPHSVRGAIAGALKKKGIIVRSEKVDGERRYRAEAA